MELLKINYSMERSFDLKECEQENRGVRALKRQMKSIPFRSRKTGSPAFLRLK